MSARNACSDDGQRWEAHTMNTMATILASMRTPRLVTIHVRNHAEFMLMLMTLSPVWPGRAVQS